MGFAYCQFRQNFQIRNVGYLARQFDIPAQMEPEDAAGSTHTACLLNTVNASDRNAVSSFLPESVDDE